MRRKLLIMSIISLILMSGCWDKEEIEQRLFVTDIGIDLNEEAKGSDVDRLIVTYQYPNINAIGKNATEEQRTYLISTISSSIFQAGREFRNRVPFPFYYKHVKVLTIGESLLKEEELVRQILDELNRDTKTNKKIMILVAEGKARDILQANYSEDQHTDGVIYSSVRDNRSSARFTPKTLTDFISDFDISNTTIVPRIILENGKFKISGGCIIKNYKFLEWVDEKENRVINFMNGEVNLETIDVVHNDDLIIYTIIRGDTKKDAYIEDGVKASINVEIEGYLQGYTMNDKKTAYDNKVLLEMENTIEKEIKAGMEKTIDKLQEINADIIGIGEHMSKFHPRDWEKIQDSWDNIFPEIEFDVTVNVHIRRTGLTK